MIYITNAFLGKYLKTHQQLFIFFVNCCKLRHTEFQGKFEYNLIQYRLCAHSSGGRAPAF